MSVRMIHYLLAALLFLAQAALLIHQSDIDTHLASGDGCAVCHVAPSLTGVASHITPSMPLPASLPEAPALVTLTVFSLAFLLPGIRSPPRPTGN
jgi:hypothetical protein